MLEVIALITNLIIAFKGDNVIAEYNLLFYAFIYLVIIIVSSFIEYNKKFKSIILLMFLIYFISSIGLFINWLVT